MFLSLLWSLRTPIAIGLAILSLVLALWGYGHRRYNEGIEVGHKEVVKIQQILDTERMLWKREEAVWKKQVEEQKVELAAAKRLKEEIVKKNLDEFFKQKKANETNRSKREDEIKASIKPTDTITVPSVFERVYNDATKGSSITVGNQGNLQVSQNRSSLIGETKTFDATSFTQVIVGNIEEYNRLASQCSKLIDVVTELEASYGTYNEGIKGASNPNGGDILTGTVRDQLL